MPRYGFRHGEDHEEMGSGYYQEEFKAKDDQSAYRSFYRRVRRLAAAARRGNSTKLWGNQELYRLNQRGEGTLLKTCSYE
jgi:hypothetical protein